MEGRNSQFWLDTSDGQLAGRFKNDSKPFVSSSETRQLSSFGKFKEQQSSTLKSSYQNLKKTASNPKSYKLIYRKTHLKLRILYLRYCSSRKFRLISVGICSVMLIAIIGLTGFNILGQKSKEQSVAAQISGAYGYKPILPKGQTTESLNSSALAATYDAPSKVLSYKDKFAGSGFTVSQQPVSDNFGSKDEAIASAIDGFGAGTKMETNKGTAYIATDRVTGYQVALVPVNKKVLVYIRSENIVDEYTWKVYIDSLVMQS